MKEMCCLSPDTYYTMAPYKEDAVLHTGSFQKAFQKKRNPKNLEGISSKREDWLLWEQRQKQRGKIACTRKKMYLMCLV